MNNDDNQNYPKREERGPRFKQRKPWKRWVLIALLVIVGGVLFFVYNAYNTTKKSFQATFQAGDTHKLRNVSKVINDDKPISILLLGTDTGALGRDDTGRTDTMILATVNPKKEVITLTSIPRDTKVVVPGDSQPVEKINAAYTIGGPATAVQTVQNLLNVPIDYYVIINMGGLEKMVNAVGGVTVNPKLTFHYEAANVVKGQKQTLNGAAALDYSRMRHQDPLGDYGRQQRQREVLQKLVMKGMNISSLPRYKQILASLKGNLKTDIPFNDMIAIRAKYGDATHHIKSQTLQGEDATVDGIDYQVAEPGELLKVSNVIRNSLGLSSTNSLTTQQNNTNSDSGADTTDSNSTDYSTSGNQ